jgi:hypothetical protein
MDASHTSCLYLRTGWHDCSYSFVGFGLDDQLSPRSLRGRESERFLSPARIRNILDFLHT